MAMAVLIRILLAPFPGLIEIMLGKASSAYQLLPIGINRKTAKIRRRYETPLFLWMFLVMAPSPSICPVWLNVLKL